MPLLLAIRRCNDQEQAMKFERDAPKRLLIDEHSPTFPEFGVLLVFIALLILLAVVLLGNGISDLFQQSVEAFGDASISATILVLGLSR